MRLRMFFADADSKKFLYRRSGGGVRLFFLSFFASLKLMVGSIFLANFHGGFALLTQH